MTLLMQLQILASLMLTVSLGYASESRPGAPEQRSVVAPSVTNIMTMPVGLAGSPKLTAQEAESLRLRLSEGHIQSRKQLESILPRGSVLMPVSYSSFYPLDRNGKPSPYTEAISVCRLNEQHDLVVVEDNRSGSDVLRRCLIRDIPEQKGGPQK
jgi:hypothetical protein